MRTPLIFFIFATLAFALFAPSLTGELIMDDWGYITGNPWITSTSSPSQFWITLKQTDYWPLSYTFYWIFYRLFGEQTLGYHVVNVLLHALNSTLVVLLARRVAPRWALVAGALFLVHPLHVQAVSWIIQFKTLLATALALVTVLLYLKSLETSRAEKSRGAMSCGAFLAFILAALAKSSVVFLPIVLFTFEPKRWRTLIPFFIVSLISGMTTLAVNALSDANRETVIPLLSRPLLAAQSFWFYFSSFFAPLKLGYMYPLEVPTWTTVSAWLALIFLSIFAYRALRATFSLAYLILLIPALGLVTIPNMKLSLVSDHWAYLPDAFLIVAIAAAFEHFRPIWASPILAAFAALTFSHARSFATEEAFWRRAAELNPKHSAPQYNLGTVFDKKKRPSEALPFYEKAVELDPRHDRALYNLGRGAWITGDLPRARAALVRAIAVNPKNPYAFIALAGVQLQSGDSEGARTVIKKGLDLNPESAELAAENSRLNR